MGPEVGAPERQGRGRQVRRQAPGQVVGHREGRALLSPRGLGRPRSQGDMAEGQHRPRRGRGPLQDLHRRQLRPPRDRWRQAGG